MPVGPASSACRTIRLVEVKALEMPALPLKIGSEATMHNPIRARPVKECSGLVQ
jgi:hypothetical protein